MAILLSTNIMRFTLGIKLALVSLLLLSIPLAGFRISRQIKQDLLTSREEILLFSARGVAAAIAGRTGLFDQELFHGEESGKDLYLHSLDHPIRLNGEIDDWLEQLGEASTFAEEHLLSSEVPYQQSSFQFTHLTGVRGDYLYAVFVVTDDSVVYRGQNSLRLDLSDHLQISIEDGKGQMHQYLLSAIQPGWVNGFLLPQTNHNSTLAKREPRIQGMWNSTDSGYIIEIRMPMSMVGKKLAFAITDIDDPDNPIKKYVIGTAKADSNEEIGWLVSPSEAIDSILKSLNRPHARVSIVDANQRIRASYGELGSLTLEEVHPPSFISKLNAITYKLFSPIYKLFTTSFANDLIEVPDKLSTLDLAGVSEALQGISSVTRYSPDEEQVEIMAAIVPLRKEETIVGGVVVEQTTNSILALQNKIIEESITLTLLAFGFGGLGLIVFAFRLSSRIRSLGRDASNAINSSGQISSTITPLTASDEIGDLSRVLSTMLDQLKIQTDFREKMADNLEHEMRTPLAGISASLKNLAGELDNPPAHISKYLEWALQDVGRLEALLTEIRDATNLQEMLKNDQREEFELDTAIEMWLEHSWRPAFAGVDFQYLRPSTTVLFYADPSRIHQMLDKLVENAVSFHDPGSPITIGLQMVSERITITIANKGPAIPKEMQGQIFNSMVSSRHKKTQKPHLGLGLFIVRTIVEHHKGTITVRSRDVDKMTNFVIKI